MDVSSVWPDASKAACMAIVGSSVGTAVGATVGASVTTGASVGAGVTALPQAAKTTAVMSSKPISTSIFLSDIFYILLFLDIEFIVISFTNLLKGCTSCHKKSDYLVQYSRILLQKQIKIQLI
jgi:hypothetical protein